MTGRSTIGTAIGSGANIPPISSAEHNQPMDLAQKSQATRITDAVTGVVKGGTTFVQFGNAQLIATNSPTHIVTSKPGVRNDSSISTAGGVTLFSRQGPQGALNLVSPNNGSSNFSSNVTVAARSISHPSSASVTIATTTSLSSSGYHIPRGAAAVANMTASRSQNISSIVRTTSQQVVVPNSATLTSTRASLISQRMVPISTSNWISRSTSTATILATKATPPVAGRAAMTPSRSPQMQVMPVSTYHSGSVKSGAIVTGAIRSQGPSTVRIGAAADGQKNAHTPKGIHISHPVSHAQKYISTNSSGSSVRTMGANTYINQGNLTGSIGGSTVYTPSSTLVTSLASSGTTITPHPANRNQAPNAMRLTSAVTSVFSQASTQANVSLGGGICLSPSSTGAILTHHPATLTRSQSVEQIPLKTPLVRSTNPMSQSHALKSATTGLPPGTHISFSGPKINSQPTQGPLALAQLTNVAGSKSPGTVLTTQAGINAVPLHCRTGSSVTPAMGRGATPTLSMTKVIPNVKGGVSHGISTSLPIVTAGSGHGSGSVGSNVAPTTESQPPHTSVFLHRASHSAVPMTSGASVTHPERNVATVTQYSIVPPYYFDSSNQTSFPVNASIVPTNHYIPSTVSGTPLRLGANGGTSSVASGTSDTINHQGIAVPIIKPNSSPRPSILRKRPDTDGGSPLKAAKNLSAALNIPMTSPPSPIRPDSRGNGNVSSGSTTISANSSPGTHVNEEDAITTLKAASVSIKQEPSPEEGGHGPPCVISFPLAAARGQNLSTGGLIETPCPVSSVDKLTLGSQNTVVGYPLSIPQVGDGVSPRKKPRKQQLMGNELQEARSSEDDFDHPVLKKIKREFPCIKAEPSAESDDEDSTKDIWPEPAPAAVKVESSREETPSPEPVLKRPHMSLINSYRQTWKARHNHFSKHSDVKPKEEKKRTVNEIANQKLAMQRVNGWKVIHLTGQVEDLVEMETDVVKKLQVLLSAIERRQQFRKPYKDFEKDVNRLSELVKANMQRSVIIKDQMTDAKAQMSKIFNHKDNIVNILIKYGNKRTLRKKEKL